jgi:hypothetical protein
MARLGPRSGESIEIRKSIQMCGLDSLAQNYQAWMVTEGSAKESANYHSGKTDSSFKKYY